MSIREKEQELFQRFSVAVPDGIVDENQYFSPETPYRIAYVLKEVNGKGVSDLREFLREGGRRQSWNMIARWTEAILTLPQERAWNDWENYSDDRRKTWLRKICAVNLKKTPGKYIANQQDIAKAAQENRALLQEQLWLYQPNIIICCGTAADFCKVCFPQQDLPWEMTSRGIWYVRFPNQILIAYSHPEARIRDCILFYPLIDAVKEILGI